MFTYTTVYKAHYLYRSIVPGDQKYSQPADVTSGPRKPWVDGPYKLVKTPASSYGVYNPPTYSANNMALLHNVLLRGLNAIFHQSTGISPATTTLTDIADFLFYCQTWANYLTDHHDAEEDVLFPEIEKLTGKKGIMDADRDQHVEIHDGLEKFTRYVLQTKPGDYDGAVLRQLADNIGKPLERHLHDEIDSLIAVGKAYDPDGTRITKVWQQMASMYRKKIDKNIDLPFIITCTDQTYEGAIQQWPPLPSFIHYIVKYIHARGPHSGSWRFGGSDLFGRPRELAFLPKGEK